MKQGCQECGKRFTPKVFWQKFCSTACKFISYGKKEKEKTTREALKEANKIKLTVILLLLISPQVSAQPINMQAICQIESGCKDDAVGSIGEIGRFQISPIAFKHFKQATKERFIEYDSTPVQAIGDFITGGQIFEKENREYVMDDLKDERFNKRVADWYFNWLFDRTWTVRDTIIAWNWGIGNWRSCYFSGHAKICRDTYLPKTTQAYLKKYEQITGEVL